MRSLPIAFIVIISAFISTLSYSSNLQVTTKQDTLKPWRVHDMNRPQPPRVEPAASGRAPSDAVVLFDGKDLSQWTDGKGNPAPWIIVDGAIEVVPKMGDIYTKQAFGDCQLHLEWMTPIKIKNPQDAGNSGIKMMGLYEVQIFDSWTTTLYPDGNAGAIYGQHPPQVNTCLKPGEWQSFDIIWHRPHFTKDGQLEKPATITVLHNGVLIQDNVELLGSTVFMFRAAYAQVHKDKLPLSLQEHHRPVRYRNIWLREIPKGSQDTPPPLPKEIAVAPKTLDDYVGHYGKGFAPYVERDGSRLRIRIATSPSSPWLDVIPVRKDQFVGTNTDVEFTFDRNNEGQIQGVYWKFCGVRPYFKKTK